MSSIRYIPKDESLKEFKMWAAHLDSLSNDEWWMVHRALHEFRNAVREGK